MKVLTIGEIIWDIYRDKQVIGGAAFNFSAHMAHLGDEVYLLSATGTDTLGEEARAELRRHGIQEALMQENSYATGSCLVTLNAAGIPSYQVLPHTAYDNLQSDDRIMKQIRQLGLEVLAFNTLIQREPASRETVRKVMRDCGFSVVFCDINLRDNCFDADSLNFCLKNATILKVSDEEAHFLYETGSLKSDGQKLERSLTAQYPNLRLVVVTLGKNGSYVYDAAAEKRYDSGLPPVCSVVSTVGAGDCYGATFLHTYLSGVGIPEAIRRATERSNFVVSHREAVPF